MIFPLGGGAVERVENADENAEEERTKNAGGERGVRGGVSDARGEYRVSIFKSFFKPPFYCYWWRFSCLSYKTFFN